MLSIDEAKMALSQLGLGEEVISEYEVLIKPFIDLHKHIMDDTGMSSKEVEELGESFTKDYIVNNRTGDEEQHELTELASKAIREFAYQYEFGEEGADLLQENLGKIEELFFKNLQDQMKQG